MLHTTAIRRSLTDDHRTDTLHATHRLCIVCQAENSRGNGVCWSKLAFRGCFQRSMTKYQVFRIKPGAYHSPFRGLVIAASCRDTVARPPEASNEICSMFQPKGINSRIDPAKLH